MGAVNIPKALGKMDGFFGCKVSFDYNEQTKNHEFKFAKNTILDWIAQFFSNEEKKTDQNADVMIALRSIEQDIGDTDNGKFKEIVTKYAGDRNLIDFKEIRRTFRTSLKMEFFPIVYERAETKGGLGHAKKGFDVDDYKTIYLTNLRKSILAKAEVQIYRDKLNDQVSDINLEGLANALIDLKNLLGNKEPIYIDENNADIRARFIEKLTQAERRSADLAMSKLNILANVDGSNDLEPFVLRAQRKESEVSEKYEKSEETEDFLTFTVEQKIETSLKKDDASLPIKMQSFSEEVRANEFSKKISDGESADVLISTKPFFDMEDWLNFYDNKLKADIFLKNGVAQLMRGSNGDVSSANLEAFCEILMYLSKQDTRFSIYEDSEGVRTQMYLELYDRGLKRPELRPVND